MQPEDHGQVLAWLAKAQTDLTMADLAMSVGADPMPDQACFHAQQAAEKALKALLVADGRMVPRTHNLIVLVDVLGEREPLSEEFVRQCGILTLYGVSARYPDFTEPDSTEAVAAIAFAQNVVARVRRVLGQ
jgi:HEPN domain-containing protein